MPHDAPADYDRTFDSADYLRQFYSTPEVSDDEAAMFRGIAETIGRGRSFPCAVEIGCGPTLHHAFALAPLVGELHLAEYLPGNRTEVRKWLDGDPAAHDWDVYFRGVLAAAGDEIGSALDGRKRSSGRRSPRCCLVTCGPRTRSDPRSGTTLSRRSTRLRRSAARSPSGKR